MGRGDRGAVPACNADAEGSGSDEQVMGVVGGWAVFSLRAMCERAVETQNLVAV